MSGLILPGGGSVPAKAADAAPAYDDLTDEQKAAVDALAANENPEDLRDPVEYAFVIVKHPDGSFAITNDLTVKIAPQRSADENDYLAAFAVIQSNMQAQQTAVMVQRGMAQQAAMMQRAMADQQLQQRLKL